MHEMQEPGVGFDAGVPGIFSGFSSSFLGKHDAGRPAVGSTVSASSPFFFFHTEYIYRASPHIMNSGLSRE